MQKTNKNFLRYFTFGIILCLHSACSAQTKEVLRWNGAEKDVHPSLYLTSNDFERAKTLCPDMDKLAQQHSFPLEPQGTEPIIKAALLTNNASAYQAALREAHQQLDILLQKRIPATIETNSGPHNAGREIGRASVLCDVALANPQLSTEDRTALVAKIAQVSYLINSPNYWDPATGKCFLLPNITTTAYFFRLSMAALIPSHPMSKTWFDNAWNEIKREINEWTEPSGGMIETPHYSIVMMDQWVGAAIIAYNWGYPADETIYLPQFKKAMEWLANISTPPDSHKGGYRRLPTIGHTYADERSSTFGLMAYLWKEKDPEFASEMQWMYQQQGSPKLPGKFTYFPALWTSRWYFRDATIAPAVPDYTSQCYPETGILFRNALGYDRETTLYLIAGRNHSHYFNDSGSITLWGKGRELLTEDDYQNKRGLPEKAQDVHSMVSSSASQNEHGVMVIREFGTSNHLDYVKGTRKGWTRQIAFVKNSDPLAPNYFVLSDHLDKTAVPATWRLFVNATEVLVNGSQLTIIGKEDVDMDLFFITPNITPIFVNKKINEEHIAVDLQNSSALTVVLYPRLKTEMPPKVNSIDNGASVKVTTPISTDQIFISDAPYSGNLLMRKQKVMLIQTISKQEQTYTPQVNEVKPGWSGGDRNYRTIRWDGPDYTIEKDK